MLHARILIADDHEVVRQGLIAFLAKMRPAWNICGEAKDGTETIHLVRKLKPDIVILDITMPGMSGLEACSQMRTQGLNVPVAIFTTHHSERLITDVRQAGAQGLVLKSEAFKNLVQAVDVILAGGTFFPENPAPECPSDDKPKPKPLFRIGLAFEF